MYSVVLATVLAVGGDATSWGHHGCHGCHGCYGCYGCYGCWGCYGCSGCYGCYGCSCYGCYGCSCYGCYGGYCSGCYGCYGCSCYGCYGCSGAVVYSAPVVVAQSPPPVPASVAVQPSLTPAEIDAVRGLLRNMANKEEKKAFVPPPVRETSQVAIGNVARITVRVPNDARLWVDSVECPLTSSVRSFNSPPLQPGQKYAYTMRVQVERNGQTLTDQKRVILTAGRQVEVDFTSLNTTNMAQR
jgi:uncharacterized protein (TIGR03000 family)